LGLAASSTFEGIKFEWHYTYTMFCERATYNFLHTLLVRTRDFQASNPRDYLYAAIGISVDGKDLIPHPNYTATVEHVLIEFTLQHMHQKRSLYIICMAGSVLASERHLPTWVRDWTVSECKGFGDDGLLDLFSPVYPGAKDPNEVEFVYDATGHHAMRLPDPPEVSLKARTLCVEGLVIDYISPQGRGNASAAEGWNHASSRAQMEPFHVLLRILRTLTCAEKPVENGQPDESGSESCLLIKMAHISTREPTSYTYFRGYDGATLSAASELARLNGWFDSHANLDIDGRTVREWHRMYINGTEAPLTVVLSAPQVSTLIGIHNNIANKFVFTTGMGGSFCLTPKPTEDGDWICILFGCPMPVILRPVEDGKLILVTDCYVEGMMHGEAIEMMEQGLFEKRRFEIV
jgi:hypothetical protein